MANVYTSAEELGMPGKAERSKDAVRAEVLANRLYQFAAEQKDENGKEVVMDPVRVQAAKILIDKGKPNLQAIEQVNYDAVDTMDEESLMAMLKSIVTANPALLSRLVAEVAQANVGNTTLQAVDSTQAA
jgi:hypothetical protein